MVFPWGKSLLPSPRRVFDFKHFVMRSNFHPKETCETSRAGWRYASLNDVIRSGDTKTDFRWTWKGGLSHMMNFNTVCSLTLAEAKVCVAALPPPRHVQIAQIWLRKKISCRVFFFFSHVYFFLQKSESDLKFNLFLQCSTLLYGLGFSGEASSFYGSFNWKKVSHFSRDCLQHHLQIWISTAICIRLAWKDGNSRQKSFRR